MNDNKTTKHGAGIKRGYFVSPKDETFGEAVVATSGTEAKKLAFPEFMGECEWIDLRARITAGYSLVSDLPVGIVNDFKLALRRGIISFLEESDCEGCGGIGKVEFYKGKILCDDCLEKVD